MVVEARRFVESDLPRQPLNGSARHSRRWVTSRPSASRGHRHAKHTSRSSLSSERSRRTSPVKEHGGPSASGHTARAVTWTRARERAVGSGSQALRGTGARASSVRRGTVRGAHRWRVARHHRRRVVPNATPWSGRDSGAPAHPWNHAPLQMSAVEFVEMRARYERKMQAQHAAIVDALSGQRLDVLQQCVPIAVESGASSSSMDSVDKLVVWLLQKQRQQMCANASDVACGLLVAEPAAGKTCLVSQVIMHVLRRAKAAEDHGVVPILLKVQKLRRLIDENREKFDQAWNWVDAYLQCTHGADSGVYLMLRQAMIARRALLLIDGVDESSAPEELERHIACVLAPQGHVMLVTTRPNGLTGALHERFCTLTLQPLSDEQQHDVIKRRVGTEACAELLRYMNEVRSDGPIAR